MVMVKGDVNAVSIWQDTAISFKKISMYVNPCNHYSNDYMNIPNHWPFKLDLESNFFNYCY